MQKSAKTLVVFEFCYFLFITIKNLLILWYGSAASSFFLYFCFFVFVRPDAVRLRNHSYDEKEFSPEKGGPVLVGNNPARTEAIAALTALGFNRISIQKSINKIIKESEKDLGVEELIKTALKHLS